jgi:hypothetical protein
MGDVVSWQRHKLLLQPAAEGDPARPLLNEKAPGDARGFLRFDCVSGR